MTLCESGDHVVASPSLYGGTYNLLHYTLPKFGVEVTFVDDPDDLSQWEAAIKPNTKVFFGEVIPNPKNDVLDIEGIAGVAHANGIPLMVDNTVPTPYLIRPLEWGADIVIHSLTKFMGGHGTSVAGAIVDGGTFDYAASGRFPNFTEPDPSYHGLAYFPALGHGAFILKARVQMLRDMGLAISPFNAFLILQGLETLSLRMERHFANAQKVAEYLDGHDQVESVNYAGLASSPWHERATKLGGGRGYGSVLAFEIKGGLEAGKKFVEGAELHSHVANIGDVRSLVIHPASTTHSQLTPEEQLASSVGPGLDPPQRRHRVDRRHHRRPRHGLRRRSELSRLGSAHLDRGDHDRGHQEADHREHADDVEERVEAAPPAGSGSDRLASISRRVGRGGSPRTRAEVVGGRDLRLGTPIELGFEQLHVHLELLVVVGDLVVDVAPAVDLIAEVGGVRHVEHVAQMSHERGCGLGVLGVHQVVRDADTQRHRRDARGPPARPGVPRRRR